MVSIALALFGIWIINHDSSTPDFGEQLSGLTNQGQYNPTTLSVLQGASTCVVFDKQPELFEEMFKSMSGPLNVGESFNAKQIRPANLQQASNAGTVWKYDNLRRTV